MVHGHHQMATHLVDDQRAMIRDAIAALREAGGHEPVGWLAPGLTETLDTPDLLAEAGIRYCADWVVDDLPATIRTEHGPMLTMPYSVELNDIPIMMIQHHRAEELYDRTVAQFERLYEEAGEQAPRSWASPCIPISAACRTASAGSSGRWRIWQAAPARCSGRGGRSWTGTRTGRPHEHPRQMGLAQPGRTRRRLQQHRPPWPTARC